jgi:hypothetical protein
MEWHSLFSERDATRWQRLRFALTERESLLLQHQIHRLHSAIDQILM